MPRHFVQSAEQVGLRASTINDIMNDLKDRTPAAVTEQLPSDFPDRLRNSIVDGVTQRLQVIEANPQ